MKRVNYPVNKVGGDQGSTRPLGESRFPDGKIRFHRFSPGPAGRPAGGWKRGLTLIELMVAALIMVVVTGAALTLFRVTATYQRHQQDVITQTQNLRAALYTVTRDIRMAGSGLPLLGSPVIHFYVDPVMFNGEYQKAAGWFTYAGEDEAGVRAIYGTDSGTDEDESDSLTLFYSDMESTYPLGRLEEGYRPGGSNQTIRLQQAVTEGQNFSSGDILAISNGSMAVIVQVTAEEGKSNATLQLGSRFNPRENMPDNYEFPAGSAVYNLRNVTFVTYYVDVANRRLVADYHDVTMQDPDSDDLNRNYLVTVAENIEDFQVSYFLSLNGVETLNQRSDINLDLLNNGNVVRAVQVAMVSRARSRSEASQTGRAVEVMGHKTRGDDGFTRRTLSEVVQLRNFF